MPSSLSEALFRLAVPGLILLSLAASVHACGPDFPNNLLDAGDEAVLVAPLADFAAELERLQLIRSRFNHLAATNSYEQQTFDAEMTDLAAALKRAKVSGEESARIIEGHRVNRKKLSDYLSVMEAWESRSGSGTEKRGLQPTFPVFDEVAGLPGEFADYFAGAGALRRPVGHNEDIYAAWEQLLARPVAERKYKSTWAAYMLGKVHEVANDEKAVEYYQLTRDLAKRGFADSAGLAVASLGREARIYYRRGEFGKAIALYLEQLAAGDPSAASSLRLTASAALGDPDQLRQLATNSVARQVITAFLVARRGTTGSYGGGRQQFEDEALPGWLSAIEATGAKDVELAEKLALAAYQGGAYAQAQRWLERAGATSLAQWLQAKLLLRAGKVAPAAALLAKISREFPTQPGGTNAPATFADTLAVDFRGGYCGPASVAQQVWGELGTLRLARREYPEALDALLRSGYWTDAAYVAERVLTVDELKTYVDREWAATDSTADGRSQEQIRYLLARRLTREMRMREARPYFPAAWQPRLDELIAALDAGWNEGAPNADRAAALFAAAKIARADGMELLGSELAPDWFIHSGNFDFGFNDEARAARSESATVNVASEEELHRAAAHRADPEARFHYRYQAAFLAWEAAKLMPDNADETARVLCTAGTWLKLRDPQTADIFYKALVRRCRKTAIGEQADRMRWFPVLDADGNPRPYPESRERNAPPPVEETSVPTFPDAASPPETEADVPVSESGGKTIYVVQSGDSLHSIAVAAATTVRAIWEANPELNATRLKVGQRILIPGQLPGESSNAPGSD